MMVHGRNAAPACSPVFTLILGLLSLTAPSLAQTTVGTGSIVGTVSDPSGAVVRGADVTIKNVATGQITEVATSSSGSFNSGAYSLELIKNIK
jgi:hypothetical protein